MRPVRESVVRCAAKDIGLVDSAVVRIVWPDRSARKCLPAIRLNPGVKGRHQAVQSAIVGAGFVHALHYMPGPRRFFANSVPDLALGCYGKGKEVADEN